MTGYPGLGMRTKPVVIGVVLIAVLIAFTLLGVRPTTTGVTLRQMKSTQSGNEVVLTLEISNHTAHAFLFYPFGSSRVFGYPSEILSPAFVEPGPDQKSQRTPKK